MYVKFMCFWVRIPNLASKINFSTTGSSWILLAAVLIQVQRSLTQKVIMYVKCYVFWDENSNFVIKNKFLYTWQLLDPAGSRPDPGIEVTYLKSDDVCQIIYFFVMGIPILSLEINFCTPGSCWILLAAILIQV